jgi:WD40 repeat protein/serine/threonine protein kinase
MPSSTSDRNLLFGILALQMDFVSRESLIKAMSDWVLDKGELLGTILVRNEALSRRHRDLLEQMVDAHIEAHEGRPEKSLAVLSSVESLSRELEQLNSVELMHSLTYIPHVSDNVSRDSATQAHPAKVKTAGESSLLNSRFRVIRPHAEGGLGRVSVAIDNELNREVALKEIRESFAHDEMARARFTLEAEVTGQLEHPGIVPVYGLGHGEDGQPFYVMRFIRGDSLKEACARYHLEKRRRTASENTLEFRQLLGRFIDVCHAVEYAHSRGVLHRDLKPGNIMLGKYGETLVVDWGLAKTVGRDKAYRDLDEQTLQPGSADSTPATQMGSALGTPQFMSPEQAAGKLNELGPASDIYSLGATLYFLLVNVAPVTDHDLKSVLAKVAAADFKSPRQLDPGIPQALNSICLKAMAHQPSQRYRTPGELADDLGRWLADEPIVAGRESPIVTVRRWIRKHPILVGSLAASLSLGFVALIVITAIVTTTNQSLTRARDTELRLRQDGERAIERAAERQYANLLKLAQVQWADGQTKLAQETLAQCDWSLRGWEHDFLFTQFHPPHTDLVCRNEDVFPADQYKAWSRGTSGRFSASGFSPDGSQVAAAGREFDCGVVSDEGDQEYAANPVVIWNRRTQEISALLIEHTARVTQVAFSRDGERLASGDTEGNVIIWDPTTGEATLRLDGDGEEINSLIFMDDDKELLVCDSKTVKRWITETGDCVREYPRSYSTIVLSPDESRIAGGAGSKGPMSRNNRRAYSVEILDLQTDTVLSEFLGHSGDVTSIRFHRDGSRLVTSSRTEGRWLTSRTSDSKPPLLIPNNREIAVWEIDSQRRVGRFQFHDDGIHALDLAPAGNLLASGGADQTVRLWEFETERLLRVIHIGEEVESVHFSPDGKELLINSSVWPIDDGTRIVNNDLRRRRFEGLVVTPNQVITRMSNDVVVWELGNRAPITKFEGFEIPSDSNGRVSWGHSFGEGYTVFDYSATADLVAVGRPEWTVYNDDDARRDVPGEVQISELSTGERIDSIQLKRGEVADLEFSRDGRWLAVAGHDHETDQPLLVYDIASREAVSVLENVNARKVAWSPVSGELLCLTSTRDAYIQLWDPIEKVLVWKRSRGYPGGADVCWSPDGERFAVCSDGEVVIHSADSGEVLTRLAETAGAEFTVRFSPDGSRIVTGGNDGVINAALSDICLGHVARRVRALNSAWIFRFVR